VAGDNLSDNYTSATFGENNVGTGITVAVTGISISGPDASNYTLLNTTAVTTANIYSNIMDAQLAYSMLSPPGNAGFRRHLFETISSTGAEVYLFHPSYNIDFSAFDSLWLQYNKETLEFIDGQFSIIGR
jgi:YDG domain